MSIQSILILAVIGVAGVACGYAVTTFLFWFIEFLRRKQAEAAHRKQVEKDRQEVKQKMEEFEEWKRTIWDKAGKNEDS